MSSGLVGADADDLEALSRQVSTSAEQLQQITNLVLARLRSAPWFGTDADHFRQDFVGSHLPKVAAAASALESVARALAVNAGEQRRASESDGSTTGSLGGFTSGGGGGGAWADAQPDSGSGSGAGSGLDPTIDSDGVHASRPLLDDKVGIGEDASVSGSRGAVQYDVNAGYFAGAKQSAGASFDAGPDGVSAGVNYDSQLGVEATADTSASIGLVSMGAAGGAFLGTRDSASAKVSAGPEGLSATAGVSTFTGADASATANVDVGGVEGSVKGDLRLGLSFDAGAGGTVSADEIEVHFNIGASLGIGGGISPSFDVHPKQVISNLSKLMPF